MPGKNPTLPEREKRIVLGIARQLAEENWMLSWRTPKARLPRSAVYR
jgi:uncharacterized membrane protein